MRFLSVAAGRDGLGGCLQHKQTVRTARLAPLRLLLQPDRNKPAEHSESVRFPQKHKLQVQTVHPQGDLQHPDAGCLRADGAIAVLRGCSLSSSILQPPRKRIQSRLTRFIQFPVRWRAPDRHICHTSLFINNTHLPAAVGRERRVLIRRGRRAVPSPDPAVQSPDRHLTEAFTARRGQSGCLSPEQAQVAGKP